MHISLENEAAKLFFQLVSSRYERASLIVTGNKLSGAERRGDTHAGFGERPAETDRWTPPAPRCEPIRPRTARRVIAGR